MNELNEILANASEDVRRLNLPKKSDTGRATEGLEVQVGILHGKSHKYHIASKADRIYNGVLYASKKEARKAEELDLRVKAGDIDFWLRQVPFILPGRIVYRLDFMTFKNKEVHGIENDGTWSVAWKGQWKIEFIEVKGYDLPMGKLKRKQVEAIYHMKIKEV